MAESPTTDVIVEAPAGSRNKYEMDHERRMLRLDRRLPSSTVFPADYGYLPDTLGCDGDPLDALVLSEEPTIPGCLVRVRIVGLLSMRDEKGHDTKILTVPVHEPRWETATDIEDLPKDLLSAIAHFFAVYKDLEPDKGTEVGAFEGRAAALVEIVAARGRAEEQGHAPARLDPRPGRCEAGGTAAVEEA